MWKGILKWSVTQMNLDDGCVMLHIKGQAPKDKSRVSPLIFEVHSHNRERRNAVKGGKRGMKLRFDEYCTSDLQNDITEKGLTITSREPYRTENLLNLVFVGLQIYKLLKCMQIYVR